MLNDSALPIILPESRVCQGLPNGVSWCDHPSSECLNGRVGLTRALLIVEILLQNTRIVRFGECKHQENARFLRAEVVGEHTSNSL